MAGRNACPTLKTGKNARSTFTFTPSRKFAQALAFCPLDFRLSATTFLVIISSMYFKNRRLSPAVIFAALLLLALIRPVAGGDHFLIIGGGDSPSNNQVSLEKNVLFFQRLMADTYGSNTPNDVLFSDGSAATRDLQYLAPQEPPRLNVLLARLFGNDEGVYFRYRTHKLPNVKGPSTRKGLHDWFDAAGKRLGDSDRLFIYFTGHGGQGGASPQDTTISMWCEPPMHASEFAGLLDRLSPKVQVVLFMVQCHSGGFAATLFKDGKVGNELSSARRCGFFATTADRNAAGCTPDTVEEDYKDYSTYFFAALGGKTRLGKSITGCDLDGDGVVSFAEAHAYVLLHSDTIDVPTTTSDLLLRHFSKTAGDGLAMPQTPYAELVEKASPIQQVVLKGLSDQLKLKADDRDTEARRLSELFDSERKTVERDQHRKSDEAKKLGEHIRVRLAHRWPELANPWHPDVAKLMEADGPTILKAIENDPDFQRWDGLLAEADKLSERSLDLERKWVKCRRFERLLTTVALAANLEKVAAPAVVERYKQLLEEEAGALSPTRGRGENGKP